METMARKNKVGLDYFPFEVSFFSDLKVRRLIRKDGGQAVSIYAYLLCLIYENGYYVKWDEDMPFIIHESVGVDESYVSKVVTSCIEVDLFDAEVFEVSGILTSKGIQERYSYVNKQCKRKAVVSEFKLIDTEGMQQKKEKEIKGKEINLEFIESEFAESFNRWLEYKKSIGKYYKVQWSIEAAYRNMKDLAENSPIISTAIVDQSIKREWDGLFELKDASLLNRLRAQSISNKHTKPNPNESRQ
ncbi:DUF4373 domain-containing protein [uncultured Dysgonomonas sp.]|uniref:Lin1244/Lin1753-like N-terminal domain-containing protein n=1 Tax=uncultured Dysgonomonas sp. TaxID=206096 RepID=A0A212IX93_9BACT|nr:DUF4373 domain-containing protein [uncultured Dysgonomonas sp.]SBV91792.1 hypothetical protein KL86DYS1_10433 [uncultured Dysgonomonas sp.]